MGATSPLEWSYGLLQSGGEQAAEGEKKKGLVDAGWPQRHAVGRKGRHTRSQQQRVRYVTNLGEQVASVEYE